MPAVSKILKIICLQQTKYSNNFACGGKILKKFPLWQAKDFACSGINTQFILPVAGKILKRFRLWRAKYSRNGQKIRPAAGKILKKLPAAGKIVKNIACGGKNSQKNLPAAGRILKKFASGGQNTQISLPAAGKILKIFCQRRASYSKTNRLQLRQASYSKKIACGEQITQ